ncbi:MAG: bifunctional pyr operon transcriptional regulator/uracil phosphoribosyltransferase PyrR [Armatimonadota bacterium]
MGKKEILNSNDIKRILNRIAHEILEKNKDHKNLAIIGIHTRGVHIGKRIADIIEKTENLSVPFGVIDINLYRDDISISPTHPVVKESNVPFNIEGKDIILVDDVLYTGRTIRAALDEIMDLGRPGKVQLAVLIDRGHRELPIQANYAGKHLPTSRDEEVSVHLEESDKSEFVEILKTKKQN